MAQFRELLSMAFRLRDGMSSLFALPLPVTGAVGTALESLELPQPITAMGKGFVCINLSPLYPEPTALVFLGFAGSPSNPPAAPGAVRNLHSPSLPHSLALPALRNLLPVCSEQLCLQRMGTQLFPLSFLHLPPVLGPGSCGHARTSRKDFILLLSHQLNLDLCM